MLTSQATPSAPLAGHVELFWAMDTPLRADGAERVLPSGTTELVFDLRDPGRLARICGPRSQPFVLERASRESFLDVGEVRPPSTRADRTRDRCHRRVYGAAVPRVTDSPRAWDDDRSEETRPCRSLRSGARSRRP